MMYRPLPEGLTIESSTIQGLGLFATTELTIGHEFGITHIQDERFPDGYIRTPLGGFFNHSITPNCEAYVDGQFIKLRTITELKCGDELTVLYWLYDIEEV
jgi:SET domain-containing protein